jgi:alkylhalidase
MNTLLQDALSADQRTALAAKLRRRLVERQTRALAAQVEADHDVVVLGGGAAGLTLALQLARERPTTRIAVVERNVHPVSEVTHKVGESTVEIAAHYLRDVIGLQDHLAEHQLRKFGLRMFFSAGDNRCISDRRELGPSTFPPLATYQVDRGRLENELAARCREAGIKLWTGNVRDVVFATNATPHQVTFTTDGCDCTVTSRWLVDATGRAGLTRRLSGERRVSIGHRANAVWFRIDHRIDIDLWSANQSWRTRISPGLRAMSTNHLMGDGYWVWLIRLPSGGTSIGIVTADDQHEFSTLNTLDHALHWLSMHEPQVADLVREHISQIQDFRVMKDYAYSTNTVFDAEARLCVTGEAGVFLDPLYSPGLDHIAICNSLATDLITRSLRGESVDHCAHGHQQTFLTIADIWAGIYRKQYRLMGDPLVMTSKVVWDTAFYWGLFGLIFFHDLFRSAGTDPSLLSDLRKLTDLSNRMQSFFREWSHIEGRVANGDYVDLYSSLNFMVELHHGMVDARGDVVLADHLSHNCELLHAVAGQLVDCVMQVHADRSDDHAVAAIQAWQCDPVLSTARRSYRRYQATQPLDRGWLPVDVNRTDDTRTSEEVEVDVLADLKTS